MNTRTIGIRALALAASVTLAACGGGGGGGGSDQGSGGNPPTTTPPAGTSVLAGGWSGSAAAGQAAQVFVLADSSTWIFVSSSTSSAPLDMFVGALQLTAGQLAAAAMRAFDYEARTSLDASAAGSYVVGSQMAFTVTPVGAAGVPFALTSVASALYNPARAAVLADIAGAWSGSFTPSETGVVSVTSNGTINTVTSAGCSSAGVLTPRANENVFDLQLTIGPAPCAAPNVTAVGTAFVVGSGSTARLYLGLTDAGRSSGASFIGGR